MMGFFDPNMAFNPYMNFRRKRKKRKVSDDDMDIFEKFVLFNQYLKSLKEEPPKKDEKKPEQKKVDTTGLAAFLMVLSFFAGQASLIYLMANMPK